MNMERVHRVLDQKRAQHPELRRACGAREFRLVAARENIGVFIQDLHILGMAVAMPLFGGIRGISISRACPRRRRAEIMAHELAHLWLHAPVRLLPSEFRKRFRRRVPERDSRREEMEADYLAALICGGLK